MLIRASEVLSVCGKIEEDSSGDCCALVMGTYLKARFHMRLNNKHVVTDRVKARFPMRLEFQIVYSSRIF